MNNDMNQQDYIDGYFIQDYAAAAGMKMKTDISYRDSYLLRNLYLCSRNQITFNWLCAVFGSRYLACKGALKYASVILVAEGITVLLPAIYSYVLSVYGDSIDISKSFLSGLFLLGLIRFMSMGFLGYPILNEKIKRILNQYNLRGRAPVPDFDLYTKLQMKAKVSAGTIVAFLFIREMLVIGLLFLYIIYWIYVIGAI